MHVCVIGAGVAGLTVAYKLCQAGNQVTVVERDDFIGGQAGAFSIEGHMLDRFYHHVFTGDHHFHRQLEELGLASDLLWLRSRMGVFHHGKIHNFGTPFDLLRFSPLPLLDRIKFGLVALKLQRTSDWHELEDISALDWIKANASPKVLEVIWGPLLRGKFGDKADQVAMAWLWNKIKLRAESRSKGMGVEKLGYLRGGFFRALEKLAARVKEHAGEIKLRFEVTSVEQKGDGFEIKPREGKAISCDRVLVSTPTPIFLGICRGLPEDYTKKLSRLSYQAAQTLAFSCRRSLSDIYWLNVTEPGFPFIGIIEHTNYVSREHYGGHNLIYISNYLDPAARAYSLSADQLLQEYLPFIRRIAPEFTRDDVMELHMFRDTHAQPVIFSGYRDYLPATETPIKGLYLANTSQIYPEDRGINYSIKLGEQAAEAILRDSQGKREK